MTEPPLREHRLLVTIRYLVSTLNDVELVPDQYAATEAISDALQHLTPEEYDLLDDVPPGYLEVLDWLGIER